MVSLWKRTLGVIEEGILGCWRRLELVYMASKGRARLGSARSLGDYAIEGTTGAEPAKSAKFGLHAVTAVSF